MVLAERRSPEMNLEKVETGLKDTGAWVAHVADRQGEVWLIDAGWGGHHLQLL